MIRFPYDESGRVSMTPDNFHALCERVESLEGLLERMTAQLDIWDAMRQGLRPHTTGSEVSESDRKEWELSSKDYS